MTGIVTFTVEPTTADLIWGILHHADLIAAIMCLAGLLLNSWLLEDKDAPRRPR